MSIPKLTPEYLEELKTRLAYVSVVLKHVKDVARPQYPMVTETIMETITEMARQKIRLEIEVAALTEYLKG
jgi:hemoglobin-like flavoprotein